MPTMIRWFVKAGLVYFVCSLLVALVLASRPVLNLPFWITNLSPVYFHLFMVGWVTQLIFGVSIWMFPPHPGETRFGNETVIWTVFIFLNVGLILRAGLEPIHSAFPESTFSGLGLVLSALLQWGAAVGYVYIIWPREKEK